MRFHNVRSSGNRRSRAAFGEFFATLGPQEEPLLGMGFASFLSHPWAQPLSQGVYVFMVFRLLAGLCIGSRLR